MPSHSNQLPFPRWIAVLFLLPLPVANTFAGPTRGGIETFASQHNAHSWAVHDTADGEDYLPFWNSEPASGNPDLYFLFTGGAPFFFFADNASSAGAFTGDYAAAGIAGLGCSFFIEDFNSFDGADIFFYSESDGRFYYSDYFDTASYFLGSGWDTIETGLLGGTWFLFQAGSYVPTSLTTEALRSVTQIGVRCFPRDVTADGTIIALDNFYLIPELVPPTLTLDPGSPATLTGSFPMTTGQAYNLWTSGNLIDWVRLEDYRDLTGSGTVNYIVPVTPGIDTYLHLSTEESYTDIPDIGP